ncbi:zwei Ig domain protein zig-8-like [Homarus americanus]|uniref:zwei Ig domain protein zig-8-like n=1 Tax=Homarus americanus TaxID=6706 RepID=UPI001C483635|nr:zwei Ig domain protein zig-8-like [Homarus americanus]XP_042241166.1 zwei Ig domain protein zig-8-like [Homarus americanus]XP_042241167.1 zwei Ig domain protein zig-8-like [Homarus americanus]XP_042241168.1 zwei Ig domain protein zig-8-like [Homarus americanus]
MQVWAVPRALRVALLLLLLTSSNVIAPPPTDAGEDIGASGRGGRHRRRAFPGPHFHPTSPTNVTTQLGAHAYLPCRIKNLGNKSVSWIRNRDSHILTVDRYTFISDERFTSWHEAPTQTWTLQVRYVQERDAGSYECQVSTEPKMSHFVQLNVITPSVTIAGVSDLYVKSGSTVNIKCVISDALEEPTYIFWYHGERRVVSANSDRILSVDRIPPDTSIGTLTIPSVSLADSGNYTCAPASLQMASVMLHVLSGELPAAMQRGTTTSATKSSSSSSSSSSASSSSSSSGVLVVLLTTAVWLMRSST